MAIFICDRCGCIDNSACGGNFYRRQAGMEKEYLCAECKSGKWHGMFPKKPYDSLPMEKLLAVERNGIPAVHNAREYLKKVGKLPKEEA